MGCVRCSMGRAAVGLSTILMVLCGMSCNRSSQERRVFPVKGQVLLDGQPVPHARVIFHPVEPWGPEEALPRGETDQEGRFVVSTYGSGDGAPAGEYKVTIGGARGGSDQEDEEGPKKERPAPLAAQYANPETSRLKVRVNEGRNDLEPFQLQRGPARPPSAPVGTSSSLLPEGRAAPCVLLAAIAYLALP